MDIKDKLYNTFLNLIPDGKLRTAAALRSERKSKGSTAEIKRSSVIFSAKTLKDWKNAIAAATDPDEPEFLLWAELIQHLRLDSHYVSTLETRIHRVLRSKHLFKNEAGDEVPEAAHFFQRPWFEQWLTFVLLSKFEGVKVIENFYVDENLELTKSTLIPMQHVNPKKGLILKEPGDTSGAPYKEGAFAKYYMQIGENQDLGILADIAPLILAKKLAMGSWLDFIEKFGIPPRFVTTDNMTQERQDDLLDMMLQMINNHVAVVQGSEKIEIGDVPRTDAHKVFDEMISRLNSEISKRILGQDGTSDNKDASGTYGSLKILQEVANDRHESDKLFAQYIINKELIPRLVNLSSFYAPLANLTFDWDESEEMPKDIMIDKAVALTNAGFILDYEILADKTGLPITGFKNSDPNTPEPNPKKKSLNPTPKQ